MKAPFPYFGGKSTVASKVWHALGDCKHYIEPFFGSGAVLLSRPNWSTGTRFAETVNDKDGFIANVWRSLQFDPGEVSKWCDWPVNHADLSARKKELIKNENRLLENLTNNPEWFDAKLAGYWIWAASCWIGDGLTSIGQIPHVGHKGKGVHGIGPRPHVCDTGKGVHGIGQIPHVGHKGKGVHGIGKNNLLYWFKLLSARLRYVRVVCGDWNLVCGGNWQDSLGIV
ncbi:MAG: DNA adenine methylase, partial [Bacteroidia bacterium]|nr:DNA adenine methylase [Bacteroidia bacterium]